MKSKCNAKRRNKIKKVLISAKKLIGIFIIWQI